jgi:hypothetical protein
MTWNITIKAPDGGVHATGTSVMTGPGAGKSVTIPSQPYSCGFNHTLTGTQNSLNGMSGTEVHPWPDPGFNEEKSDVGGTPPSWDASGGGPETDTAY